MINIEKAVYSSAVDAFKSSWPSGSCYGEPVEVPASFPCMTLIEEDNSTYIRSLDAEKREHHASLVYDVNVYSNLIEGAKQQCKSILETVDEKMQDMGFTRMFCRQTKNQDERIFRMTARYRGVVSEDYRIYRR